MDVIWSFVRRSLAQNKTRTAVSIIGVVLSTALMMAVFTTVTSIQNAIVDSIIATEGTWHVFDSAAEDGWEEALRADTHMTSVLTTSDVGVSALDTEESAEQGGAQYDVLAVRSLPRTVKGTDEDTDALCIQPTLTQGRLPQADNELMVPQSLLGMHASGADGAPSWEGELSVGSTLTLMLGQRATPSGKPVSSFYYAGDYFTEADDAIMDENPDAPIEQILDPTARTFTVVGAYQDQLIKINELGGADSCLVAFTSADAQGTSSAVWIGTDFFTSRTELAGTFDDILGEGDYYTHSNLLSFGGLTGSNAIWASLWVIAGVLVATIMIAAVSLIYNSFAIAVAERTRQFGLLSSLGASRKQLGWTVLLEAGTIGLIGIPLGVLVGVAGVAATLSFTSQALADLVGTYTSETVGVHVEPTITAIVVVLSIVTLLVSALVPALRAGRVSATDAIRQTRDIQLDRATRRRLSRATEKEQLVLPARGLRERLGGMGGLLANRNLRRSGARGRVVVASLAVSVLLLVSSGSIAQALNAITERYSTTYGAESSDVVVSLRRNTEYGNLNVEETMERLSTNIDGIEGLSHVLGVANMYARLSLPQGSCSDELIASGSNTASDTSGGVYADGSYANWGSLLFTDDAVWQELAHDAGVDTSDASGQLYGLIVNRYINFDAEGRYVELSPVGRATTATVYAFDVDSLRDLVDESFWDAGNYELVHGNDGQALVGFVDYTEGEVKLIKTVPADETASAAATIEVLEAVSELPNDLNSFSYLSNFPTLLLPLSAFGSLESLGTVSTIELMYDFEEGADAEAIGEQLDNALQGLPENTYGYWQNAQANLESTRRILDMVYLFIFLFSLITMLIAVANVFNTLSNNIILRTREFAVLKSCGMDNRAFGRMLLSECASYASRGLVIGLGLATLASWTVWNGMSGSIDMGPFTLPWSYVTAAIIGVVVVLAISVAYALRRSHALNVVEALRADAI